MRALVLFLAMGCAHQSARYVNVAAVRHEIADTIDHAGSNHRSIVSMGHVTSDSAVVYTQTDPSAPREEETWVKQGSGWTLQGAQVAR